MTLVLRTAARSDVGVVRSRNEDSGYAAPRLVAVADGMGGHAAGELASATAVATLAELDPAALDPDEIVPTATALVDVTSQRIAEATDDDLHRSGMGTTLTSVLLMGNALAVVHVGDSRAYLLRDGTLAQITRDHTYVQTLIDAGHITEDEAATHPRRNLLMRVIDGTPGVMVDVSIREARVGDRLLVCSDGLTGVVPMESLQSSLLLPDPTACVTELVENALAAGAPDNVTVIVADVIEAEGGPQDEPDPVVVGAAAEPRNRVELPDVVFPVDVQPDPEGVLAPTTSGRGDERRGTDMSALRSVYREHRLGGRRPRMRPLGNARRSRALIATALGLAVVLLTVAATVLWWARGQWFVTADDEGRVIIGNGVSGQVLGVTLSRTVETSQVQVTTLPAYDRALLEESILADSLEDARAVLQRLSCRATPPVAPCPLATAPSSDGDATSTATPGPTAPAPTASASGAP